MIIIFFGIFVVDAWIPERFKMQQKMIDHIVFIDPNSQDKVIFNYSSWTKIIIAIIVKYAHKTDLEAELILKQSDLFKLTAKDYDEVMLTAHELEYHWAMYLTYGDLYWLNGISAVLPSDYLEWERAYRKAHQLAKTSFEF